MAGYPARGSAPWFDQLKAYIDDPTRFLALLPARLSDQGLTDTYGHSGTSLNKYGLATATNLATVLDAAVAAGEKHVVIPRRTAPWPLTSLFTYAGTERFTIEFEPGARVSCDMAVGAAFDLKNTTLINASLTSPFTGPITPANWSAYALPARVVLFRDNCRTEGDFSHEYAASGIQIVGAHCRIMGDARFRGMRHRTGWAEGIHVDGGLGGVYDFVCHGHVTVTDSDRAIEVEEGVYDITFLGGGLFENVWPVPYTGQPVATTGPDQGQPFATYTFTLGAHSHQGGGSPRNVRYYGEWVLNNCGAGVTFGSSSTLDAERPTNGYVESVKINGLALAPGSQAVSLAGYNNVVDHVHFTTGAGIAGGLFRVRGYGGANNQVKRITSDAATRNLIRTDNDGGPEGVGGLVVGPLLLSAPKDRIGKYIALSGSVNGTNGALGNQTLRLIPYFVAVPTCVDRIGTEVTVAGQAGSVVRLGIYTDENGLPGTRLVDSGDLLTDTIGIKEATIFTVLLPGWYWVGGVVQGAATTQPTLRSAGSAMTPGYPFMVDTAANAMSVSPIGRALAAVSGALPATWTGTIDAGSSAAPRVFVRLN